jgi:hypothetical protein
MVVVLASGMMVWRASGLLLLQAPAAARPAAAAWIRPVVAGRDVAQRLVHVGAAQQRRTLVALAAAEPGASNEYFAVIDEYVMKLGKGKAF